MSKGNRKRLYEQLNLAGRELSARSTMFHAWMAERFGLSVTDWRAWDMVLRHGPLTAGSFSQMTGLTPGAVTGLIDRLVAAGAVRRVSDARDRRRIMVEAVEARPAKRENSLFAPMLAAVEKLYADYSDKQLRTIAGFMQRMATVLGEQTGRLKPEPRPRGRRSAKMQRPAYTGTSRDSEHE